MKIKTLIYIFVSIFFMGFYSHTEAQNSTKKERNLITSGNKLYEAGKYKEALGKYQLAVKENPSSVSAQYNLGLSQIRLGSNPGDTTQTAKEMLKNGCAAMEKVATMGRDKPLLASRANYNLGNVAFNSEDYSKALQYYKQALRLNPDDDNARRNLRITQLKLQNQNQDQDNKDQDKEDEKDKNEDQQKEQNQQDQNKDQQPPQQQPSQPQPQEINPQTAEQILNAMENKENQTRARVANEQGEKARARGRSRYNW